MVSASNFQQIIFDLLQNCEKNLNYVNNRCLKDIMNVDIMLSNTRVYLGFRLSGCIVYKLRVH